MSALFRRCLLAAGIVPAMLPALAGAEFIYGVTNTQTLVTFNSNTPGSILSGVAISGLQSNERLLGIDLRPQTGQLYALGSSSRLYTIDPISGSASMVGGGAFANTLNGSSFGFDFNPTIDRIRVVSDANQNLVLHPDLGTSTQVTDLFFNAGDLHNGKDPNVVGSAYSNNFKGSSSTQLFGVDSGLDILVKQANSAGTLDTVGSLGTDISDVVGFDISGSTNIAYLSVMDVNLNRSTLWTVDLGTGAASMLGEIGGGTVITSMTVVPAPGALALAGVGMLGIRRRRSSN